jgi:N-acylneuraminate cytidylyltransferase
VKPSEHAKVLVNPIAKDGSLKYFDTDFSTYRRQNTVDYSPNGAIFIAKPQAYMEQKHFFGKKALAYIMDEFDSVDIDTELDFKFATLCMKERLNNAH